MKALVIDINKCNGCYNCQIACKDEYCGQDYPGYSAAQPMTEQFWMNIIEKERGQKQTVVFGDTDECAGGTAVTLTGNGKNMTVKTSIFGDFEF